jgi:hypothetical protein
MIGASVKIKDSTVFQNKSFSNSPPHVHEPMPAGCIITPSHPIKVQRVRREHLQPLEHHWWAECINIVQQAFNLPNTPFISQTIKEFHIMCTWLYQWHYKC